MNKHTLTHRDQLTTQGACPQGLRAENPRAHSARALDAQAAAAFEEAQDEGQAQEPVAPVLPEMSAAPERKAARSREATPYKHGKGYAIRRQYRGHAIFLSGFKTQAEAKRAMNREVHAIDRNELPSGAGATRTTLAQALQDYAMVHLPFMKGAAQEARRINNYLRAAGLRLLKVTRLSEAAAASGVQDEADDGLIARKTGPGAYFSVQLVEHTTERVIPPGLHRHRKALLNANARTDKHRAVLANTVMSDITREQMQAYIGAMRHEGHSASTIALERSVVRVVFNYAFTVWRWTELFDNPATRLKMPKIDNNRTRVLTIDEQALLEDALAECRNTLVAPALTLLRETAMRASEPLERAVWGDVDWTRSVLTLRDAKAGAREVPLSPAALQALQELSPGEPNEPVVRISYESLRAAWRRACERAGIEDLRIHDLRHTAATRLALSTGNVFLVQKLTGHKNLNMLERYVNVSADDVVEVLRTQHAKAAEQQAVAVEPAVPLEVAPTAPAATQSRPSNVIAFPGRRVA